MAVALLLAAAALTLLAVVPRRGPAPLDAAVAAPTASPAPTATPVPTAPSPTDAPAPTAAPPQPSEGVGGPAPAASTTTPPATVVLAFAGDSHGERQIGAALLRGDDPLAAIAPVLSAADVAVVNLETAVGSRGTAGDKSYTFQAPPVLLDALRASGVDVVSVANNHSLDFGVEALLETVAEARARDVAPIGAGRDEREAYAAHVVDVRGTRIAFVGLTRVIPEPEWAATADRPGLASAYTVTRAAEAIRSAAATADHVVAVLHWGQERADCPDEHQVRLATALHDAGATVVVGAHPHVWQGVAAPAAGRLTAFSLGNFLWYASGEVSGLTAVLTVELGPEGVTGWELTPAVIGPDGGPVPVTGELADRLRHRADRLVPGIDCPVAGVARP